ncbi:alkyl sulfatase dimerization domain-containing protein [Streptomyces sp. HNA39]|uniref:alkyl sulfatase dimerization domain-containing protein n=1 Tax=Streptomyces sp. HNA39 TaxID=2850561 RepID=UPI00200CFC9C|nr:alkyl sulfatase dimerization domain-containing protein [Streptomyces sp. HNA39]
MECTGGADAVVAKARTYAEAGDLRFAAILLNHVVFADASHRAARAEPAGVYRRLGHGAENGPWRNFHLMGAKELEEGAGTLALDSASPEMAMALTVEQPIDSLAVRVDGPRAWDMELVIDPVVTDGSATGSRCTTGPSPTAPQGRAPVPGPRRGCRSPSASRSRSPSSRARGRPGSSKR